MGAAAHLKEATIKLLLKGLRLTNSLWPTRARSAQPAVARRGGGQVAGAQAHRWAGHARWAVHAAEGWCGCACGQRTFSHWRESRAPGKQAGTGQVPAFRGPVLVTVVRFGVAIYFLFQHKMESKWPH